MRTALALALVVLAVTGCGAPPLVAIAAATTGALAVPAQLIGEAARAAVDARSDDDDAARR